MPTIRFATPQDIPLIRDLCFRVWPQTYRLILADEQIEYMLKMMYSDESLHSQMTTENCRFIIVSENEIPAGFASFGQTDPSLFKLHKIYILHEYKGKGLGKFVIDFILNEIKIKGAEALQLQVNKQNPAKKFYENLGFSVKYEAEFPIGNGFVMDDYVMEKKIDTSTNNLT